MSNALSSGESGSLRSLDLRLPPLPQTLPQVLELLHRPGFVPAEELAEVVQGDPAAVARLLKHINSAYYGLRRSITSVERAIRMMGPTTAAGTVIGLRMLEMEDLLHGPAGPCLARLLRHSESTAFLTQYLLGRAAPEANAPDPTANAPGGKGFAEGLLHDFGKLVLLYNYPEKAAALYDEQVLDEYLAGTETRALEQLVFGCDHTEAGRYAAAKMHFPPVLTDVIRHHHAPGRAESDTAAPTLLRAVRAANRATKAMGPAFAGLHPSPPDLNWAACAEAPVWSPWQADPEANAPPMDLMNDLRAKRSEIVHFTKFFLEIPEVLDPIPPPS